MPSKDLKHGDSGNLVACHTKISATREDVNLRVVKLLPLIVLLKFYQIFMSGNDLNFLPQERERTAKDSQSSSSPSHSIKFAADSNSTTSFLCAPGCNKEGL
jgi:hypothetical protein